MNYTDEQAAYMIEQYKNEPTRETVDRLAEELNKSIKSIIGKLSREGVYKKQVYTTKRGEKPITKIELVAIISNYLGMDDEELQGLEKSPKLVLQRVEKQLKELIERGALS